MERGFPRTEVMYTQNYETQENFHSRHPNPVMMQQNPWIQNEARSDDRYHSMAATHSSYPQQYWDHASRPAPHVIEQPRKDYYIQVEKMRNSMYPHHGELSHGGTYGTNRALPGTKSYYVQNCEPEFFHYPKRKKYVQPSMHSKRPKLDYRVESSWDIPSGFPIRKTGKYETKRRPLNIPSEISTKKMQRPTEKDATSMLLSLAYASEIAMKKDGHEPRDKTDTVSVTSSLPEDLSTSSTETKTSPDVNADPRERKKILKGENAAINIARHYYPITPVRSSNMSQTTSSSSSVMPVMKSYGRTPSVASMSSNTTETKGKPFKCDNPGCNCSFSTRFSLKRHMKKHTGERPHICPYNCGKRFAEKSTLTRHVRIHTGERPYICKFPGCGKSFADRTNVKRHELIHLGQRPYHCKYCDRGFFRPKQVVKHVAKMHPNKE